ncbi:50S ribosomal protein L21 [bacterium]|nr:50S ribosomal protein L21 [bacterium]
MYAVIRQGGHQYRVTTGDVIQLEKLEVEAGQEVTLEEVLAVSTGEGALEVGEPRVVGAVVKAKVIRQGKSPKVDIYKMRRRKGFARTGGHRQPFTEVRVISVEKNGQALA